ncbi:MAG: hypothetical protein P8172_04380 [Gammaproteobacteria bacterium]
MKESLGSKPRRKPARSEGPSGPIGQMEAEAGGTREVHYKLEAGEAGWVLRQDR